VPEITHLLDVAERSRVGDWSLRSALVRYAQAEPVRVGRVLDVVRRLEAGMKPHLKALEKVPEPADEQVAGLLGVASQLDELGDRFAAWAVALDPALRPGAEVDELVAALGERLDVLGVARDEARPSPGPGGRPRRRPARGV
jgi:hypothetical protein